MSDIIQLLPDTVANQIAAGEVIQRPASIIKELVENSVDAGATMITIAVVDAGRTSIQVIDNGKGMSETDARLSFERHATSKIKTADDLFALNTMGFRGEALASIAAVAQVELKTRREEDEMGTHISMAGSKVISQEVCACPVGANFLVENLFYNVPARRKFLKSNSTELNHIVTSFERIALVYPHIGFKVYSNGTEIFNLPAVGQKQRIIDIFGKRIGQELLSLDVDTTLCKVTGFVGKPESAKKKGAHQYFFVNGRYMKHPYFHKAIQTAFDRLIPQSEQIPYFIYFTVNPEDIDVNIHPTKTEIKFENEQAIWQILLATVKESVGMFSDVPSFDFDVEGKPDIPVYDPTGNFHAPKVEYNSNYNPFENTSDHYRATSNANNWEKIYDGLKSEDEEEQLLFRSTEQENFQSHSISIDDERSPMHYQYKGKYLLTSVKSGLMLLDQHRAHIRVLYEKYIKQIADKNGTSQRVLFPEVIQVSASDDLILGKIADDVTSLGFELTHLGSNNYAIHSIPADCVGVNPIEMLQDIISSARDHSKNFKEEMNHSIALSLARSSAIPYGQILSNEEMEHLINSLFSCSNVNYTPDGNKIITILKQTDIDALFSI